MLQSPALFFLLLIFMRLSSDHSANVSTAYCITHRLNNPARTVILLTASSRTFRACCRASSSLTRQLRCNKQRLPKWQKFCMHCRQFVIASFQPQNDRSMQTGLLTFWALEHFSPCDCEAYTHGIAVEILSVRPSVCLSVRQTRVLWRNEST